MKTNLCNHNLVNREILIISSFQKQLLILSMNIIISYLLIISIIYFLTMPYRDKIDNMLKEINLSTFNALWLAYVEGLFFGAIIMIIIL